MRISSLAATRLAAAALVLTVLVFVPISSQAQETVVHVTGNNATSITDLVIGGVTYDITFLWDTSYNVYENPPTFPFQSPDGNTEETSLEAAIVIREALNAASTKVLTVGPQQTVYYLLSVTDEKVDAACTEDCAMVHTGWESRYNVDSPNRTPEVWTAADNWDPDIFPLSQFGGFYPFGLNVWEPDIKYTFALATYADDTPPADVDVGGSVTGLEVGSDGVVLELNDNVEDLGPLTTDGVFTFNTQLTPGASYTVTVDTQPGSPAQFCTVAYGTGTVPGGGVDDVLVTCTDPPVANTGFLPAIYRLSSPTP